MGLDDRDYMRDRSRKAFDGFVKDSDRPFTPPKNPSLVYPVLTWLAAAFLLYKAFGWWEDRKQHRSPTSRPVVQQPQEELPWGTPAQAVATERLARVDPASPGPRVYVPAPRSQPAEADPPRTGGTIYLCRDYGGGSFWASNHCNQHKALIDRIASVPPGLPFEQQVQIAEQHRRQALAITTTPAATHTVQTTSGPANKTQVCQSLDERVNQLDAEARQPLSAAAQDWNRSERQKARDEQFRLRC